MLSLEEMAARAGSAAPVGLAPGQDWHELALRRDAWRDALASEGCRRAALYFENTFEFAAALLGAWACGCTAVLAGDAAELTAKSLAGGVDAFLGEFKVTGAIRYPKGYIADGPPRLAPVGGSASPVRAFPAAPIVIHTSGSTGKPVAVEKTGADIGNELATLEATLGESLAGSKLLSTVSHQHIYGLLFRCLWPLAAGHPFSDRLIRFPEELAEAAAGGGSFSLAASPAFLRRLPESPVFSGRALELRSVFSSGGPLPWDAASACGRIFGIAPTEVYGSSETGGIAWRRRESETQAWNFFPGVEGGLGPDGNLVLAKSPHVSAGLPLAVSDRVRLAPGGFEILGRSDRLVKLEEKRLSLTAMEDLLMTHPRVAEARLVLLPGARATLGAVLRLKGKGIPIRGTAERAALLESLRDHLLKGFERVLLPKRWRLVEAMPINAAGKTAQSALAGLFDPMKGPFITASRRLESGAEVLELSIPAELDHFQGHFPQAALLPGVVQLHWAIEEGKRLFGPFGEFRGLQSLKFQKPIFPGMTVSLELARLKEKPGVSFKYDSGEGRHASGQAVFAT